MRSGAPLIDFSSEWKNSRPVAGRASISVASALLFSVLLSPIMRGQGPLLLIATGTSQPIQNRQADADHLSRMVDLKMIRQFHKSGLLVSVPARTRFYYLHSIQPNYRYLRPWAKIFLERLSREHFARFKRKLRVTSLVRTVAFQRALAATNGNAAAFNGPLRSSHLTGATLDISKHDMTRGGISWMRKVLYSLRKSRYIYAIEEFQQPTFHVMVYHRYQMYVKRRRSVPKKADERIASDDDATDG